MKNSMATKNLIIFLLLGSITSYGPAISLNSLIEKDYLLLEQSARTVNCQLFFILN